MSYNGYSSEEKFAEAFRRSALAYRELRDRLGERFREAQQEAYASWSEWDETMGADGFELNSTEEITGTVIHDLNEIRQHKEQEQREAQAQQEDVPFDFALVAAGRRDIGTDDDVIPEEDLIEIDILNIDGAEYTALSNGEGDVFLHPPPSIACTSLLVGEELYALRYIELDGVLYCLVVDLAQGELEYFLGRQHRAGSKGKITFQK